jgi:mutator protein MutT
MAGPDDSSKPVLPAPCSTGRVAIEVAAGLVFRDQKLLITQRYLDSHLGGLWEFPGGKREPRETMPGCLRRELQEELGIDVEVKELIESIAHDYPEKSVRLEFFRCALVQGEPEPLGCAAVRWVTRTDLDEIQFPAADARLLEQLRKRVELWQP